MKNPFARTGFDTYIAKDVSISDGVMNLKGTTVIDGSFTGTLLKGPDDATLVIGGSVTKTNIVDVGSVTITGTLECDTLTVQTLAVKNGAKLVAKVIQYRTLIVEPNAIISGSMEHQGVQVDTSKPKLPSAQRSSLV